MNERIKELAVECTFFTYGVNDESLYDGFNEEKFAELIVRECSNRVSGMVVMDKGHIPPDPHSQGWNSAVAYASKELKRYYGVEE